VQYLPPCRFAFHRDHIACSAVVQMNSLVISRLALSCSAFSVHRRIQPIMLEGPSLFRVRGEAQRVESSGGVLGDGVAKAFPTS